METINQLNPIITALALIAILVQLFNLMVRQDKGRGFMVVISLFVVSVIATQLSVIIPSWFNVVDPTYSQRMELCVQGENARVCDLSREGKEYKPATVCEKMNMLSMFDPAQVAGCALTKGLETTSNLVLSLAKAISGDNLFTVNIGVIKDLTSNKMLISIMKNVVIGLIVASGAVAAIIAIIQTIYGEDFGIKQYVTKLVGSVTMSLVLPGFFLIIVTSLDMFLSLVGVGEFSKHMASMIQDLMISGGIMWTGFFMVLYLIAYICLIVASWVSNLTLWIILILSPIAGAMSLVYPEAPTRFLDQVIKYTLLPFVRFVIMVTAFTFTMNINPLVGIIVLISATVIAIKAKPLIDDLLGKVKVDMRNPLSEGLKAMHRGQQWMQNNATWTVDQTGGFTQAPMEYGRATAVESLNPPVYTGSSPVVPPSLPTPI